MTEPEQITYPGEGPNLVIGPDSTGPSSLPSVGRPLARRKSTKGNKVVPLPLVAGRPVYEKNRCTVTLTHGDPETASKGRRTRTYIVASDLSEESLFAIEWAIGTVLREGDTCILVSVMETDTKCMSTLLIPTGGQVIGGRSERNGTNLSLSRLRS